MGTFAVACIVGHYSKTMVIFLLPQIANFLYSCPQLFRVLGIPCPRHRMPAFDAQRGQVKNSYAEFKPADLPPLGKVIFWIMRTFRLAHVLPPREDGTVQMSNLTLINMLLYLAGPCREDALCIRLLLLQVSCSGL